MNGLFNSIKERYLKELDTEEVDVSALEKSIVSNLWQNDFIEIDNKIVNIYNPSVKVVQVLEFFKSRMPWIKLQVHNLEQLEKRPDETLAVKFVCFNQLAGLLADVHTHWRESGKPQRIVLRERKDDTTTH